jgi:hypothetical protein
MSIPTLSVTTTQTLSTGFGLYLIDAAGGNLTLTLPNIIADGLNFSLRRLDSAVNANTVTLQGFSGAQTIDGAASVLVLNEQATKVIAYNTKWYRSHSGIPTSENYVSAFDTSSQGVSVANTFQTVTFTDRSLNGWTYSSGSFTCPKTGLYSINYYAKSAISLLTGIASSIITKNGTEIAGSQCGFGLTTAIPSQLSGLCPLQFLSAGDVIALKFTGTATTISIAPVGSGVSPISASLSIIKLA